MCACAPSGADVVGHSLLEALRDIAAFLLLTTKYSLFSPQETICNCGQASMALVLSV